VRRLLGGDALGLELLAFLEPAEVVLDEESGVELADRYVVVTCNTVRLMNAW
jgi:hypothetical protein